ncbi:MAG TPA: MgtC/SapB family protein [Candidatus Saccharimonadales bacterium]|jgi:putative Mg2+ transporter-C (MgtC) family protein|nr:MgtC/SapB family protein [Candidatus Saccharimonadales bacterium]
MENNILGFLPHVSLSDLLSKTVMRLILSAFLGGIIGLERELKRRPAGLRTNMFICFGAAMFTILSEELAGTLGGDHTRIAAQIIPGIGFIGAGSILHSKGSVTGLTTAATLFVVASIGMACGGGLYLPAIFATLLIFLTLEVLGWFERRLNLKPVSMRYVMDAAGATDQLIDEVKAVLAGFNLEERGLRVGKTGGRQKLFFSVDGTRRQHTALMGEFRQSDELRGYEATPIPLYEQ